MTWLTAHIALAFSALLSWGGGAGLPPAAASLTDLSPRGQAASTRYGLATDSPFCTIPFTRAGNLIVIKATVDTLEGNFILDTGAPGLVLNLTYFRDYPLKHIPDADQAGITGTVNGTDRTDVNAFVLGTFRYSNIEADVANLGHIENSKNIRILGLIGLEFFRQCAMFIDFENNEIQLQYLNSKTSSIVHESLLDTAAYRTIPIEIMDNRIVTTTELGGKKLKMIVDCAAETNILNSRLPNRLLEYVSVSRRVKLTGSGARQADALYGNLSELRVAGEAVNDLPVLITNLENTCFAYNGCIDGVLGFDFLSLHKIGFNFVKRKMYIWK